MDDNNSANNNVANEPEIQLEPQKEELHEAMVEPQVEVQSEPPRPVTLVENAEVPPSQDQTTTGASNLTTNSQEQKKPKSKKPFVVILIIIVIIAIGVTAAILLLTGSNNKTNESLDNIKQYCERNKLEIAEGTRQTNLKMDYVECKNDIILSNYGLSSGNKTSNSNYISISFGVAEKPILEYEDYVEAVRNYGIILEESGNYLKAYSINTYDGTIGYVITVDNTYIELIADDANVAKTALIELGYPDDKWPSEQDLRKGDSNNIDENDSQKEADDTFNDIEIDDSYFVSDDKKYVLTIESELMDDEETNSTNPIRTHMVYYYLGDKITGMKTIGEFVNADNARKAFDEIKESDEDMTYYRLKDKYIIVTGTADQYEGMTVSDVKEQIDFMESLKNTDVEEPDIDDY